MAKKYSEPKYLVQPADNNEFYFKIAKEYKDSNDRGQFHTLSYKEWLKKYKKTYTTSNSGYIDKISPDDKR